MKVSVVMPTYNGERFLREQLDSIVRQSRCIDELLVGDDASDDGTVAVVEAFAATAAFNVHITRNDKNRGLTGNLNDLLRHATGEVILFSDQDDVWLDHHVERLVAPLEADPRVGLVQGNSTFVAADLEPRGHTLWEVTGLSRGHLRRMNRAWPFPEAVRHRVVAGHAMAIRDRVRDAAVPLARGWMYDQWVMLIAAAVGRIVYVEEPVTLHRQHEHQTNKSRRRTLTERAKGVPVVPTDRFEEQVQQWGDLVARLEALGERVSDPADAIRRGQNRIELLRARRAMRDRPAGRFLRIASQLVSGRYHRVGRGWLTVARDLRG